MHNCTGMTIATSTKTCSVKLSLALSVLIINVSNICVICKLCMFTCFELTRPYNMISVETLWVAYYFIDVITYESYDNYCVKLILRKCIVKKKNIQILHFYRTIMSLRKAGL